MHRLRRNVPELAIALIALFFTFRELGTFPRSWLDEGLFIMTAKWIAAGHGYGIPLLENVWNYPYFLAVGPTIILPSALSIKLLGLSVAAARVPMTLYLLGSCAAMYAFTRRVSGQNAARWSTLLLVTLSAFVNTGKPVLGEVPAFFFLMLGFIAWERLRGPWKQGVLSGVFFGLSILTKLTFGLILPALGIAGIAAIAKKDWKAAVSLTISGMAAVLVYLPWRLLEIAHTPAGSLTSEIGESIFGSGELPLFNVLLNNRGILLGLPFLTFALMSALGLAGVWWRRTNVTRTGRIAITALPLLFLLYYLGSYGWYRHLLPGHLLLLAFVPAGSDRILGKRLAAGLLLAIAAAQGVWQLDHRGAGLSTALQETVHILETEERDTDMIIDAAEVFGQLRENPHWLYLIPDNVSPTMPPVFRTLTERQKCFALLTRLAPEEAERLGERVRRIGGYHLVEPPPECGRRV